MAANKDILFFSNYCEYSKEVLNALHKKAIKQDFTVVCVDNAKFRLPEFVTCVPLIFTTRREILVDDRITEYLDELVPPTRDIEPFSLQQGAGNYSDVFSFLDSAEEGLNKAYTYLGNDTSRISMVPEDSNGGGGGSGKSKLDSSLLEKYMAERDSDLKTIKAAQNPSGLQYRI